MYGTASKDNKLRVIKLIKYKYKIKKNEYNNDVDYGIQTQVKD